MDKRSPGKGRQLINCWAIAFGDRLEDLFKDLEPIAGKVNLLFSEELSGEGKFFDREDVKIKLNGVRSFIYDDKFCIIGVRGEFIIFKSHPDELLILCKNGAKIPDFPTFPKQDCTEIFYSGDWFKSFSDRLLDTI